MFIYDLNVDSLSNKKNTSKNLIGFVILTWNSERVIKTCLKAIYGIKTFDICVIVVDNGSQDNTVGVINGIQRELQAYDTLEILCLPTNLGTTVSRNIGLHRIQDRDPDYICILDSDTIVNEDAFYVMTAELKSHPEYGLIGPKLVSIDGYVQNSARPFPTVQEKIYKAIPLRFFQRRGEKKETCSFPNDIFISCPVDYLMSACWLMKPEILQIVGYLDEKIFYAPEDAEYCIQIWKADYEVAYCPKAIIIHEWQRLSRKKYFSRLNWEHIKGLIYMFWKHQYLFNGDKFRKI